MEKRITFLVLADGLVNVRIDNGYSVRHSCFASWAGAFGWLRAQAAYRQDPAGRALWNYRIEVVQGVPTDW